MTDAFEDESEPTVSIGEYLKDVEQQELEADLVLGGDEGKECTYDNGYMKRQAIFSCLTCTPEGNAGLCTACSLACHDGHEVVELWTKRNFRCDCGNSKFGEFFCKLLPSKDVENPRNSYNQNFRGFYCSCGRPFPDPDAEDQVEMIQCCVCEDWFHNEHLGLESPDMIPRDEEGDPIYEDFICQACASSCSFLKHYPLEIFASVHHQKEVARNDNDQTCILGMNLSEPEANNEQEKGKPMFLSKNWREALCRCLTCVDLYNQRGVAFLLDKDDTIAEYEAMAKQKREALEQQRTSEFLNKLGHVEKMEILSGLADIKDELHSFLASFDPSKPVTSDDVRQIFDNLAKKRRRMD